MKDINCGFLQYLSRTYRKLISQWDLLSLDPCPITFKSKWFLSYRNVSFHFCTKLKILWKSMRYLNYSNIYMSNKSRLLTALWLKKRRSFKIKISLNLHSLSFNCFIIWFSTIFTLLTLNMNNKLHFRTVSFVSLKNLQQKS